MMGARSPWGTVRRGALSLAFAATLASGALVGDVADTASATTGPCALPDRLVDAGVLTEAAQRYHALEHAGGGRAAVLRCVRAGLRDVERTRHRRARDLRDAIRDHNREVRRAQSKWRAQTPPRTPLSFHRRVIARQTSVRLRRAARLGREDEIAHLVAHGIARGDGLYGLAISRVLQRAHFRPAAAAVVAATVAAHPAVRVPPGLRSLAEQRRRLTARQRRAARRLAARGQIVAAEAYSEAGLDDDAQAAVKRAIALDPSVDVPYEVRSPTGNRPFWNSVRGHFGSWLRTILELLIAALVVAALLVALSRFPRRFRARPVIEQFTGEPKEAGPATTAAVRESCAKLREDGGHRLKIVESSGESFQAIPKEIADVYAPAGPALALLYTLGRLIPSRTRRVTGQVRPRDPQRGGGLTVTFGRPGKVFEETTLWERDFGSPPPIDDRDPVQPPYDRVALPAAVWLTFVSANHTLRRGFCAWLGCERPFRVLGTTSWLSFAHFAVGAERQASNDHAGARQAYHRALGIDPRNRGAKLNLASLDLLAPRSEVRASARQRLEDLRITLDHDTADEVWFRVRYCQIVGWLNMDLRTDSVAQQEPQPVQARTCAVELCAELLEQDPLRGWSWPRLIQRWLVRPLAWLVRKLERRWSRSFPWHWHRRAERPFLRSALPGALLILAVALQQEEAQAQQEEKTLTLQQLKAALFALRAGQIDKRAFDAQVTHRSLVAFVVGALPLNADAFYNHACYEARAAAEPPQTEAAWGVVERQLHEAMRRGGPATAWWATIDPTLETFRSAPHRMERLLTVVSEVGA
jgi:hypothetical protein